MAQQLLTVQLMAVEACYKDWYRARIVMAGEGALADGHNQRGRLRLQL